MRRIFYAICLTVCIAVPTMANTAQQADIQVLRELESKKVKVRQQIDQLPKLVEQEANQIMLHLDDYWRSDRANARSQEFIAAARIKAADVHLDDKYGTLETLWAEYKSLASSDKLEEIATDYINDLTAAIVHEQDEMFEGLRSGMEQRLTDVFLAAQSNITTHIDTSISTEFKYWPQCFTSIPIKNLPPVQTPDGDQLPGTPGWPTVVGAGLLAGSLLKKMTGKIAQKIQVRVSKKAAAKATKKVAGKVAGKFIPFIGWVLLGFDAVDAATARSRMEDFLRDIVLEEYASEMSPAAIWHGDGNGESIRAIVDADVRQQLSTWGKQAGELATRFLETAILIENPTFKVFVTAKAKEGWDLSMISDYCAELSSTFGPLCKSAPSVDSLINMMVLAPSRPDLRRLCDLLGENVFNMFDEHGQTLLAANSDLGPEMLVAAIRGNRDWKAVHRTFNQYLSQTSSQQARDGFLLCIDAGLDLGGIGNPAFFEAVSRYRTLFAHLVQSDFSQNEIASLLADAGMAALLQDCMPRAPEVVVPLARTLPHSQLARYNASGRTIALLDSFAASKARGLSVSQFVRFLQDSDAPIDIYQKAGSDGLEIWLSYVSSDSGTIHAKWASQALRLFEKGCPKEICMDKDNLSASVFFYSLPGGAQLYSVIYPWLDKAPWLSKAAIAIFVLLLLLLAVRVARSGVRRRHKRRSPKSATSVTAPALPPATTSGGPRKQQMDESMSDETKQP